MIRGKSDMATAEPSRSLLPAITPRIATAPLGSSRLQTVPKRYEETKPVVIQGHAHRMIIGIGHELQRRSMEMSEVERLRGIREAEQAVWAQAEQIKAEAVQRAKEESRLDQEKLLKKVSKAQEKALKEEALRVEMAMQKLAIEQVKQERLEAEQRLKDALTEKEKEFTKRLSEAVSGARKEEQNAAAKKASDIEKSHKDKLAVALKKAETEKTKAVTDLEASKNKEMTEKISKTEENERKKADNTLQATKQKYEAEITQLKGDIQKQKAEINKYLKNIQALELAKLNVETKLHEVYTGYQDFINRSQPFEPGMSDYLLQPVYIDEVGKVPEL
ncbi:uncharacterized protein C6orf163 homolog [Mytilus galloprovincialis]|uniref:uncharacterized protein C6orf163 homolog n=1 Tax=Mytilus galloprovincialis TaxID=29158 RepID=UPI003F7BA5FB